MILLVNKAYKFWKFYKIVLAAKTDFWWLLASKQPANSIRPFDIILPFLML